MDGDPVYCIRHADWNADRAALRKVRYAVFVQEQGIPETLEWDASDAESFHLLAVNKEGQAIATARLLASGQIGRMAVLSEYRDHGIGSELLRQLLTVAKGRGLEEVFLHAQISAIPFYRRFGFRSEGPTFEEAGIPHQQMRLPVR